MEIAETIMTFGLLACIASVMFAIGFKYGQSHFDEEMVDRANTFVQEYCAKENSLVSVNNVFSIENGTFVFDNRNT